MNRLIVLLACWACFLPIISAQAAPAKTEAAKPRGEVTKVTFPAPSLKNSFYHIPTQQVALVYLPPSYKTSAKRYPTVYFLIGYGDQLQMYLELGIYQGFVLNEAMDRLIDESKVKEMIVVIPNAMQFMGGSFYVNSPLNGNWEDYIVSDLTGYIDSHFRTLSGAASRGIAGHSMGGFGAFNIAMRHPDIFGAVYALSPGLAAPDGLKNHFSYSEPKTRDTVITKLEEFAKMPVCESPIAFMSYINLLANLWDFKPLFAFAYGAAFAPNLGGKPPYIEYPYEKKDGKIIFKPQTWQRLEAGFGAWDKKVVSFIENFRRLRYIAIDYGTADEHEWIPPGCEYVSNLLKSKNIAHDLVPFSGKHEDHLRERIENFMLPSLSQKLKSD